MRRLTTGRPLAERAGSTAGVSNWFEFARREGAFDAVKCNLPLAGLRSMAALAGVQFISLQCAPTAAEMTDSGDTVYFFPDLDADTPFADSAALISILDLVITSDTSVAHLAGALRGPCGSRYQRFPTGGGCWRGPIALGIPRCGCFVSSSREIGRRCSGRFARHWR